MRMTVPALAASLLIAGLVLGCKPPPPRSPVTLATETVTDPSGAAEVEIAYEPRPERQIELLFELRALGLDEMDKIVLELRLDGFVLIEGQIEWSGFVPPRQPQSHRLIVQAADDVSQATVRVSVRKSVDSTLLMERELAFGVSQGKVEPLG